MPVNGFINTVGRLITLTLHWAATHSCHTFRTCFTFPFWTQSHIFLLLIVILKKVNISLNSSQSLITILISFAGYFFINKLKLIFGWVCNHQHTCKENLCPCCLMCFNFDFSTSSFRDGLEKNLCNVYFNTFNKFFTISK